MSIRKDLEAKLRDDFASFGDVFSDTFVGLSDLWVTATEAQQDDIQRATLIIRQKSIGKSDAAPNSHRDVGLLLTLVSPHLDQDMAGDDLEERVEQLLDYLDTFCRHGDAEIVAYGESRLAFDIPITILAKKE